jgi:rRNA-processing protein FCF1
VTFVVDASVILTVALEHDDAVLVTADDRYRRKPERHGIVTALADWENVS